MEHTRGKRDRVVETELPHRVTVGSRGSLEALVIESAGGDTGTVLPHGAHLLSWAPAGRGEQLFVSAAAAFEPGKAVRGGIPVCFPWFGLGQGPSPMQPAHGPARVTPWRLVSGHRDDAATTLTFELTETDLASAPGAQHLTGPFVARYTITLGQALDLAFTVTNTGQQELVCEVALHTYLAVADVAAAQVLGLDGATYRDKPSGQDLVQHGPVTFGDEVDRVYTSTSEVRVVDGLRVVGLTRRGSSSVVVWNIGEAKAGEMTDLGPGQWREYLCVEAGRIGVDAMVLAPGEQDSMAARLEVLA